MVGHTLWQRWRRALALAVALALPLQGFAAVSGLWCAQRGFHAPAWIEAAPGHGHPAADADHGPAPTPAPMEAPAAERAAAFAMAPAAAPAATSGSPAVASSEPCHAATGGVATASLAAAVDGMDSEASAPSAASCAQCAGCHGCALLPAVPVSASPRAADHAPPGWAPTPHAGPWLQSLERPPRPLLN
jgi:hypothetical protein